MRRYFLYFSYDGSAFHGWQIQPNAITVQQEMQQAMQTLFQEPVELVAAGRTDTGVHAAEMVAHFDYSEAIDSRNFIHRLNSLLPKSIAIKNLKEVKPEFHARFDAIKRTYTYRLIFHPDPFLSPYSYEFRQELNLEKMNQACAYLLGEKDFSSFSKSHTQTFTNDCEIFEASWKILDNGMEFRISANRFLRNMVRAIVGTLLDVGTGKIAPADLENIIAAKKRSEAGSSVPASGLFLSAIEYPSTGFI